MSSFWPTASDTEILQLRLDASQVSTSRFGKYLDEKTYSGNSPKSELINFRYLQQFKLTETFSDTERFIP